MTSTELIEKSQNQIDRLLSIMESTNNLIKLTIESSPKLENKKLKAINLPLGNSKLKAIADVDLENESIYFEVLGKKYESNKFVQNYTNFIKDIISKYGTRVVSSNLKTCDFTNQISNFCNSTLNTNRHRPVGNGFHVNVSNKNKEFVNKINKICNSIGIDVIFYNK